MTDGTTSIAPAGSSQTAAQGFHAGEGAPAIVVMALILVLMVPIELSFSVGGLFLTPSKVFLVIMAFAVIPRVFKTRLHLYDYLFAAHVLWTAMCYGLVYGFGASIERSGTYILEMLVVYLIARTFLTRLGHLRGTVMALFVMMAIAGAFAVPEGIFRERFIHDFFRGITGVYYPFTMETRMGILRSASFFEHQILYGVFCASVLTLVWYISKPGQRIWRTPIVGVATFMSASSAPLMLFILQLWLILLEFATRQIKNRVMVVTLSALAVGTFLQYASNRGVVGLISAMTFNPSTAYARQNQWTYGIQDVLNNPIFGFDVANWTRPPGVGGASVDNYWLLMMMRAGFPSIIFLALAALLIWLKLARRGNDVPPLFRQLRIGWGMTIMAIILGGATVAYFGKLQPLFAFYMGFGAALAAVPLDQFGKVAAVEPVTREIRYTRFGSKQAHPGPATTTAPGPRPAIRPAQALAQTPAQAPAMSATAARGQAELSRSLPPTTSPSGRKAT